jgi:hypothetical protein
MAEVVAAGEDEIGAGLADSVGELRAGFAGPV